MKHNLTLVKLSPDQIARAKEANGSRKRITHALICGPYGQRFGTEKQCLKYFTAWDPGRPQPLFPTLFDKAVKTDTYEITDYDSTWELTMKLLEASKAISSEPTGKEEANRRLTADAQVSTPTKTRKRSGFFGRLFSKR